MTPFWSDLDDMRWVESYITIPNKFFFFFIIFKKGSEIPGCFSSTNERQRLDGFGRHGVESDVTGPFCICYSEDGK